MKTLLILYKNFLCVVLVLSAIYTGNAQNFQSFSGKVVDVTNNKKLHLASLTIESSNISTVTNKNGEFTIKVPENYKNTYLNVSYLGFETAQVILTSLTTLNNKIELKPNVTELDPIELNRPKNAKELILKALELKGENYVNSHLEMTSFYRETIKKRQKNASLSEAVLKIKKTPYTSNKQDQISIIKARKSVDYNRLDTLAFKLQGGPYSAIYTDVVKYTDFIFSLKTIDLYNFSFANTTEINGQLVYVINFKQNEDIDTPLYYGQLYINANTNALTRASYKLNLKNEKAASEWFIRKKPNKASVIPTEASYLVNYNTKNNKWYYSYSNIFLEFKVKWKSEWFSKRYSLQSEMAITNWQINDNFKITSKDKLNPNSILEEKVSGFSDSNFWGAYNIIEPEKTIENAIKKISKQLEN